MTTPFDPAETAAQNTARAAVRSDAREQRWDAEVAPLLAAQGVDVDALKGKGLEALNEALALAAERHKLTALTPRGAQRTGALIILRAFVEALDAGDERGAREILSTVAAEPVGDAPAVSHVIGTAAGLLDEWFAAPAMRDQLLVTPVPRWSRKAARAVAGDVLGLARRGRVFASLDGLRKRHSGMVILEGAALSIAAASTAVAMPTELTLQSVLGRLLVDDEAMAAMVSAVQAPDTQSASVGSSFVRPGATPAASSAPRVLPSDPLRDRFGAWLAQQKKIAAPNVEAELEMFRSIVELGDARGLDLERPDDVEPLIDLLRVMGNEERPEVAHNALATLDDYLHYRLLAAGGEAWEMAHVAVESAIQSRVPKADVSVLGSVLAAAEKTDPEAQLAALMQLRLVTSVNELLEWIGRSKEIAEDGSLAETDVARLKELLGGAGVREWWTALVYTGVIEAGASRARRGAQAGDWAAGDTPPLTLAEKLVMIFVAETLTAPLGHATDDASRVLVADAISTMLGLLSGNPEEASDQLAAPAALETLTAVSLIVATGPDRFEVPEALRGVVARGTLLAMEILTGEAP